MKKAHPAWEAIRLIDDDLDRIAAQTDGWSWRDIKLLARAIWDAVYVVDPSRPAEPRTVHLHERPDKATRADVAWLVTELRWLWGCLRKSALSRAEHGIFDEDFAGDDDPLQLLRDNWVAAAAELEEAADFLDQGEIDLALQALEGHFFAMARASVAADAARIYWNPHWHLSWRDVDQKANPISSKATSGPTRSGGLQHNSLDEGAPPDRQRELVSICTKNGGGK